MTDPKMQLKTLERELPFTEKVEWTWPEADKKLVQVFEHVSDIDEIMKFVDDRSLCVQAGGACGVWPYRFAQFFDTVLTFEPLPVNFACLVANTEGLENVVATNAPLTNDHNKYSIHNEAFERENLGAGYIIPDPTGIESVRIDDLQLESCGLIQLDIEGSELDALMGGFETIEAYRPVIVLEEKRLNHVRRDPAGARKFLEREFGYSQVGEAHRDVILTC